MKKQTRILLYQKIILTMIGVLVSGFFVQLSMALPPAVEADRLILSASAKMNNKEYEEAGQELDKVKSLNIELPVDYYFQYGRYLAATKQAVEAKKNLETYLDKAGKEGKFYSFALEIYSYVEANEKRWAEEKAALEKRLARYKDHGDGTVTDTQTGLMWAARDNGGDINWQSARDYCQNYKGGGHSDWRMPTRDELAGLYDQQESGSYKITPRIKLTECCPWGSETRDSEAAFFNFSAGTRYWSPQSDPKNSRALPVRTNWENSSSIS